MSEEIFVNFICNRYSCPFEYHFCSLKEYNKTLISKCATTPRYPILFFPATDRELGAEMAKVST